MILRAIGVAVTEVILPRLVEPSTWIGLATLAGTAMGIVIAPQFAALVATIGSILASMVLVVIREERGNGQG